MRKSAMERIMSHVDKVDGHWLWTAKGRTGLRREYGGTRLNGKAMSSHRAVWILHKGSIPFGIDLLHQCDVKLCCNPAHLRLGTQKENIGEAVAARNGVHWQTHLTGEKNQYCKLTDKQVIAILKDAKTGMRQRAIAEKYGITPPYVSMLVSGKTRKDLTSK